MSADRLKQAFRDLQQLDPLTPYRGLYRAKVLAQSADFQKVDVRPYWSGLPDMAGIELRHGIPGLKVQVSPGCTVQLGWDDGNPTQPFAGLWSKDAQPVRVILPAQAMELGIEGAADFVILGTRHFVNLTTCLTAIGSAFSQLGKVDAASACTAMIGTLASSLSPRVRVG